MVEEGCVVEVGSWSWEMQVDSLAEGQREEQEESLLLGPRRVVSKGEEPRRPEVV